MTQTPLFSRHQHAINAMVEKACSVSCYSQDSRSIARSKLLALAGQTRGGTKKKQFLRTLADSLNADVWCFL